MVSFDGKFDGKDEVYMMAVLVILLSATSLCLSVEDGWGGWRRLAWLVAETFRLALCLARQAPSRTRTPSYPNIDNYEVEVFTVVSAIAFPYYARFKITPALFLYDFGRD